MKLKIFPARFLNRVPGMVALVFGCLVNTQAQDLLVNPKRVVFEGPKRIQELNIANIGRDSARYAISFIQIRMNNDGSFQEITQPDSGQHFADKFLRIFPRTITLAPNEAQLVKVQLTGTSKLSKGEYRSHLYFRSILKETPLGEKTTEVTSGVSVSLTPVFGISIPVIIRKDETNATVRLSDLKLENERQSVGFRIHRTGTRSVFGNLKVEHISPAGKVSEVGIIKGVAVYTPNQFRDIRMMLKKTPDLSYRTGKLRVTYSDAEPDRKGELASAEISLR